MKALTLVVVAVIAASVLVAGAAPAPTRETASKRPGLVFVPASVPVFKLRLVGSTPRTVTFGWKPLPNVHGYRFIRDGVVVSRTKNRTVTSATFWKGSRYAVDALIAPGNVSVPFRRAIAFQPRPGTKLKVTRAGLVFRPAPKIDFRLRLVRQTKRTVTFGWKRQPGVDGYRLIRNGVVVSRTFDGSLTRATFWKGSRYVVEALRVGPHKRVKTIMRAMAYTKSASGGSTSKEGNAGTQPKPSTPSPKPGTPSPKPPSSPSPPAAGPGAVVSLSGSYSPGAFLQAIAAGADGPLTAKGSYTITDDVQITRPNLRIEGAKVQGTIDFMSSSSGSSFVNGEAMAFNIRGADDITLQGNTFDGQCRVAQNWIEDDPAGVVPERFKILDNTFRNYHLCANESAHSEALFVGYSNGGLIAGNTFSDNGTTGHIFFSWYGGIADPSVSWPRNICVRNNTFIRSLNGYYHIQVRSEIPDSSNIDIDPSNVKGASIPGFNTALTSRFARPC